MIQSLKEFAINQIQQAQQSIRLEDLINRNSGLSKREKNVIFEYIRNGQSEAKSKKEYITYIIIIFNSFFEYGFLRRQGSSSSYQKSYYSDQWPTSGENPFSKIEHYWEFITMLFNHLDTVRYINFKYDDAANSKEKALGWIMLALNQKEELKNVLIELFNNIHILQLYSKEESYLWQNKKELLQSCDYIDTQNMHIPSPLLENFIQFGKQREERKDQKQIVKLLGEEEEDDVDESPIQSYTAGIEQIRGVQSPQVEKVAKELEPLYRNQSEEGTQLVRILDEQKPIQRSDQSGHDKQIDMQPSHQQSIELSKMESIPQQVQLEQNFSVSSKDFKVNDANINKGQSNFDSAQGMRLYLDTPNDYVNPHDFQRSKRDSLDQEGNFWMRDIRRRKSSEYKIQSIQNQSNQKRFSGRLESAASDSQQSSARNQSSARKNILIKNKDRSLEEIDENYQYKYPADQSKRLIDKIFEEGDLVVPIGMRHQFKMVMFDKSGAEFHQSMTNADLVFFNEFYDRLKIKEYTYHKKEIFMKRKQIQHQDEVNKFCGMCMKNFPQEWSFFKKHKYFCHFCFDHVCKDCICEEKVILPSEYQLFQTIGKNQICQEAYTFINKFEFIKIDKENPMLQLNKQLRKNLVLRRKVHKLFNQIKCNKWEKIFQFNKIEEHKNLILRDCYLTFEQASNPHLLHNILIRVYELFHFHIVNCPKCYYKGEKCQICLQGDPIKIYEVDKVAQCTFCHKKAHRECLESHNCQK